MPFTFSHPAIVLPLLKLKPRYISGSAVVIGSMAPDFEYFINMRLRQVHGHTLAGTLYYDLPITLICLLIFHGIVKKTLIDHLPDFLQKKFHKARHFDWFAYAQKNWYVVVWSALLGIFSHLFWDAFTHAPGYFVQYIPFLNKTLDIFGVSIPCYDLMQLLSTLVGGMIVLLVFIWPLHAPDHDFKLRKTIKYVTVVFIVAVLTMIFRGVSNQNEFIATSIAGTLIGLIAAPFILQIGQNKFFLKEKQHENTPR